MKGGRRRGRKKDVIFRSKEGVECALIDLLSVLAVFILLFKISNDCTY